MAPLARSPYTGKTRRLVIAFDIGTTYSGVSYSILIPGEIPEILPVTRFPHQGDLGGNCKIPTVIFYDKQGKVCATGIDYLGDFDPDEVENWTKVQWFKMHLRPKSSATSDAADQITPLPPNKTVIDIFADFMAYLYDCTRKYIQETFPNQPNFLVSMDRNNAIDFILTHPNGLAKLVPDTDAGRARIRFVTEGEASLQLCIQRGLMTPEMETGEGVLIVDAGGGTIDISAYSRNLAAKEENTFEEIAAAQCFFQGSIYVTNRARCFIENRLNGSKFQENIKYIVNAFDKQSKLTFRNNRPLFVPSNSMEKDAKLDMFKGSLRLEKEDVAGFFKPSIDCIIDAIKEQRRVAKKPISTVFLVGGFAASDWLYYQIEISMKSLGVKCFRPDSNVNKAVADGGVSYFIDHSVTAQLNVPIRQQSVVSQPLLVQLSGRIFKSWTPDILTNTEALLSEKIESTSSPSYDLLACRAILRAHLKHVALAMEDGKQSLQVQPTPIGYIAMAIALLGQGDRGGALRIFDLAFHDCELNDTGFILLLKSILVFESGNHEDAIIRVELLAARADNDSDNDAAYLYMQVLAVMYMKKGNYRRMIPLVEQAKNLAPKDKRCFPLIMISFIFGWSFDGSYVVAQQCLCESLYAEGRTMEAVEILCNIIRMPDEDTQGRKTKADWVADFIHKCAVTLERTGDEALCSAKHDDAITQYSAALSLGFPSPAGLLIKRSRARAARGLWEDALQDANEAVKADSSNPWGYEAKHAALHNVKRYDEAIDALNSMLHAIEQSHDPEITQLRKNYIAPSQTIAAIDSIAREILKSHPPVVIDVATGCLCDGPERRRTFEADPSFKELVSSMTSKVDDERIREVVERYFGYVMFSHAWQGDEPSFQEVNVVKSVWNLPDMPLNEKLRNFCKEVRRRGHNWAWSDTCCIDKTTGPVLSRSLTSMYKWYADSTATLVFLAGIAHPSNAGDLAGSFWMTRAWTLQELLAPKVVFFYDSEWRPYLNDTSGNHKESLEIMQELADAIKIPLRTIATFTPDNLKVRDKLRLASTRNAMVDEDVAYSLIGIFKSDIRPHYGEGPDALGHLLEEIVTRFGEVTVLAWTGKSSSYNSCLPASISVYGQTPYNPPSLEGEEMESYTTELRGKLSQREALSICKQVNDLSPARFAARRLHLPCIVFPVRRLGIQGGGSGNEKVYRARVSGLGNVEFTTADDLTLEKQKKFVFVHPWIGHIRGPSSGLTGEDDWESDTDTDTDSEGHPGWDGVALTNFVAATPRVGGYVRALQMIARLGQPFSALLLVQQPSGEYKRVATENEIVVPGLGTAITPRNVRTQILEIL